jgi:hypothetical protein
MFVPPPGPDSEVARRIAAKYVLDTGSRTSDERVSQPESMP